MRFLTALLLTLLSPALAFAGQLEDGRAAFHHHDYQKGIELIRPLAEKGDPAAQFQIGWTYENGKGVAKDEAEAAKWYQKAADQDYAYAEVALGAMYKFGRGVKEDREKYLYWFRKAASQGDRNAQNELGWIYQVGVYAQKDLVEAYFWHRLAGFKAQDLAAKLSEEERQAVEKRLQGWKPVESKL